MIFWILPSLVSYSFLKKLLNFPSRFLVLEIIDGSFLNLEAEALSIGRQPQSQVIFPQNLSLLNRNLSFGMVFQPESYRMAKSMRVLKWNCNLNLPKAQDSEILPTITVRRRNHGFLSQRKRLDRCFWCFLANRKRLDLVSWIFPKKD